MAPYMIEVGYTTDAWAKLIRNPQNRIEAVRPAVEAMGGRIEGAWYAFGKHDVILIVQMPDNVSAAALSLAFGAGGAVRSSVTTPLMTADDGVAAMKKAGQSTYKPPTG